MEVIELRRLPRQMLERPVVTFDKGGRGDLDQIPEHEAALDEAFHGLSHFAMMTITGIFFVPMLSPLPHTNHPHEAHTYLMEEHCSCL